MIGLSISRFADTLYGYNVTTTEPKHAGIFSGVFLLVLLAIWIVSIIAFWRVFEKAGKHGWAAIIPIYNGWVLFEISGKPGWWVLLGLIPFLGGLILLVLYILAALELAKRFGKSPVFAVFGLIIFSLIGFLILGYGDAKYNASGTGPTPTLAS